MRLIIITGAPGVGKTSVAEKVAKDLGYSFFEIDDMISENVRIKIERGELATEEEAKACLTAGCREIQKLLKHNSVVAASVMMRKINRRIFFDEFPKLVLIKLNANIETLLKRLKRRKEHFFKPETLKKLLSIEEPIEIEHKEIDAEQPFTQVVEEARSIIENEI